MSSSVAKLALSDSATNNSDYKERMNVDFPIEEVMDFKLGQEVVVTIRGCISRLEGMEYSISPNLDGCIGIQVSSKTLKKTGNDQAAGIQKIVGEDTGDDVGY